MKQHYFYLVLVTCLLNVGCSDDKQQYAGMSDDNVFKDQVEAIEKTKAVESTIHSSFEQRTQQVE